MSNLLNAIVQYLNQDLNKMEELNKELGEEITNLKQVKNVKKEDNKLLSLEEKLKKRIEERENRLESLKKEYVKVRDFTIEIYGERIKNVFKTYSLLCKLDEKNHRLGLKTYSQDFEYQRNDEKQKMYFLSGRLFWFNAKVVKSDSVSIGSLNIRFISYFVYDKENDIITFNIHDNCEYTNDNALSLETKKVIAICELANAFENFEKRINDCVEKILEEQ
jgi:hypothetical protein